MTSLWRFSAAAELPFSWKRDAVPAHRYHIDVVLAAAIDLIIVSYRLALHRNAICQFLFEAGNTHAVCLSSGVANASVVRAVTLLDTTRGDLLSARMHIPRVVLVWFRANDSVRRAVCIVGKPT